MSRIEIILLIGACIVPFVALAFALPKAKRLKEKLQSPGKPISKPKTNEQSLKNEQNIKENIAKDENLKVENQAKKQFFETNNSIYDKSDFKSYLQNKQSTITPPKRKKDDFNSNTMPYDIFNNKSNTKNEQELDFNLDLSPELYAMIIAGVFDKKF